MKNEMPILGKVLDEKKEEIDNIKQRQAKRKIEIMDQLDEIKVPILCTILVEPESFDYRNKAFWNALANKDQAVRSLLVAYLNKGKK